MLDKDYKRSIEHAEILKGKIIGIEKEKVIYVFIVVRITRGIEE
jgi:hypothetical protein